MDDVEPVDDDLAPCICGRMSRQVPCWRCVEEDERHEF